jgi:Domain of unknown function (DUF4432)
MLFGRSPADLREVVGDLRQLAGVRSLVLDDGPERGVRVLAFDTGGGLAFWALVDRCLDLGTLHWRGVPLAWQGPAGFRHPAFHDAESETGQGLMRSFGGLLVTCGLDHIRQPVNGQPLHGRLPFTPARLTGYGEDWDAAEPVVFAEGEVVQSRLGGEHLRLQRRLEAPVGGRELRITDAVTNRGPRSIPQALLYHINFGFPLVAPGSLVRLQGVPLLGPLELPQAEVAPCVVCRPAPGEDWASAILSPPAVGGPWAPPEVEVAFRNATLPWIQVWLDPTPGTCALGVEPCTSERLAEGRSGPEKPLEPGETRRYEVVIRIRG